MVVGGIEDELEWLTHDLPDPNDPRSWVEQHGRLISNYGRAMRRLTATQTVLDELAAQFVDPPTEFVPDVRRASPRHLGTMHSLYERITADSTLSKASSAVKFIALAMKEIGWEFPKNSGAIEQVLVRRRRKRRERSRPDATTCVK